MANTLDSSFSTPDPAGHFAGQKIYGDFSRNDAYDWQTIGQAANYILARCHAKPLEIQAFSDNLCQQTAAGLTSACRWRVPRLTGRHSTVRVAIRVKRDGASGTVRFQSTEGANTLDLVVPAVEGWVPGTLTLGFDADGYDVITMCIAGDGTDPTLVHAVGIQWDALTAPLPTTINGQPTRTPRITMVIIMDTASPRRQKTLTKPAPQSNRTNRPGKIPSSASRTSNAKG